MAAPAIPAPSETPTDPIERIDDLLFGEEARGRAEVQPREPDGKFAKEQREEPEPAHEPEAREEPEADDEPEEKADAEEEPEEGEEEGEEAEEEGTEEKGVYTFDDLAKGLEIAPEELAEHLHIEGPEGESVPLAEAIKSFREQPERAAALAELSQEREQLQAERAAARTEADQELNRLAALTQAMIQRVNPAAAQAELQELRRSGDTQGYLLRKAEIEEEQGVIQQVLGTFEAEKAKRAREDAQNHEAFVDTEVKKLKSVMPEWRKREKAAAAMDEIGEYLRDVRGFSEQEVSDLTDHRMVLVAYDAVQFRRLGKKKPEIAGRIAELRKKGGKATSKGGKPALPVQARQPRSTTAARELRASRKRLRETGSDEAADDFFGRIM